MVIHGTKKNVDPRRSPRDRRDDASIYKAYEQVIAAGSPLLASMAEVRTIDHFYFHYNGFWNIVYKHWFFMTLETSNFKFQDSQQTSGIHADYWQA